MENKIEGGRAEDDGADEEGKAENNRDFQTGSGHATLLGGDPLRVQRL